MDDLEKSRFPAALNNETYPNGQQEPITMEDIALVIELDGLYHAR